MPEDLRDLINKFVADKISANRRLVDEVLEKIQEQNHQYFLEKFGEALKLAEDEERAGNAQGAMHYKVLADTYKAILERCF